MKEIVAALETEGALDFLEYFERQETIEEALVAFFGLLELIKSRTVQAVQDEHLQDHPGPAAPGPPQDAPP